MVTIDLASVDWRYVRGRKHYGLRLVAIEPFREWLWIVMEVRHWSPQRLAREIGYDQSRVHLWLGLKKEPKHGQRSYNGDWCTFISERIVEKVGIEFYGDPRFIYELYPFLEDEYT